MGEPALDLEGQEEPGAMFETPPEFTDTPKPRAKAKPGRPINPNRIRTTTVTKQEMIGEPPDANEPKFVDDSFAPLFDALSIDERTIVKVRVIRRDPDEGMVGYIDDPTTSDHVIAEQWGGSVYRLEGLGIKGNVVAARTIKIAGDPIFKSTAAEAVWRRSKGLPPTATINGVPQTNQGMGVAETLQLLKETASADEKRREEAEDRRRREDREHQVNLRKLELEAEERKRKFDAEIDDRRKRDEDERDTRRKRDQAESEQRQQNFMQQTIQMMQASSNQALELAKAQHSAVPVNPMSSLKETLAVIATVKDVFATGGGDGEPADPMTMLWSKLPDMVGSLASGVGSAIREIKTGGVQPSQQLAAASPLGALAGTALGGKLEALAVKIASKGGDPEQVLSQLADNVMLTLDGNAPQPKPAVAATVRPQIVNTRTVAKVDEKAAGYKSTAVKISFKKKP